MLPLTGGKKILEEIVSEEKGASFNWWKKILEEIVSKEKGACLNWWKKKCGGNSEQGKSCFP